MGFSEKEPKNFRKSQGRLNAKFEVECTSVDILDENVFSASVVLDFLA